MRNLRTIFPKTLMVIGCVFGVCTLLVAEAPEGNTYEVTVSIITPSGPIPVACTCLTFDPNPPACMRSPGGGQFLWSYSPLDLDSGIEVQATTGVALSSRCGGPRAGFEGIALHGTIYGTLIELEAITELGSVRTLSGFLNKNCSIDTCQIVS